MGTLEGEQWQQKILSLFMSSSIKAMPDIYSELGLKTFLDGINYLLPQPKD